MKLKHLKNNEISCFNKGKIIKKVRWYNLDFIIPVAIKLTIGFIALVVFMNLNGRSQLAPTSTEDQIGNYVLGGIIGGVIYNPSITIV